MNAGMPACSSGTRSVDSSGVAAGIDRGVPGGAVLRQLAERREPERHRQPVLLDPHRGGGVRAPLALAARRRRRAAPRPARRRSAAPASAAAGRRPSPPRAPRPPPGSRRSARGRRTSGRAPTRASAARRAARARCRRRSGAWRPASRAAAENRAAITAPQLPDQLARLAPGLRPLLLIRDLLQVERRDHVQQHPVGEELPDLLGRRAREPRDLVHDPAVARAHVRPDHGIGAGGIALHLEQQRGPVGQQLLGVSPAHRRQHLVLRDALRRGAERLEDAPVRDVVAGEEELALGLEEPEQVRLRDPGLARDRVGRGALVAAERELLDRERDDLLAPLLGGLARADSLRRAHPDRR